MSEETEVNESAATAGAKAKKPPAEVTTIKMADGRVVDFAGKRKLLKDTFIEDGKVRIRLDFRNGETRNFVVPDAMVLQFAGHGAEQKLGDEIAGTDDVDDCTLAVDDLIDRLQKGEWSTKSAGNGMSGQSVLLKALIEHTGKSVEQIKAYLQGKNQGEKMALRQSKALKPIIERIEAEKASKQAGAAKIDVDAELGALMAS